MRGRTPALVGAVVVGLLVGWIVSAGVVGWSDDGQGGSAAAELVVGLVVGVVAFAVTFPLFVRLTSRGLLGAPERLAGGVGEESASSAPTRDRPEGDDTPAH